MTVYLDLIVGLNFAVDFLLILAANSLAGFPAAWGKAALAAALGGVYAGVCMVPGMQFLGNAFWRMVFLGLMGICAFGCNRSAWRRTGIFVLLTMAMGGIALCMGRREFPALILSGGVIWLLCVVGFGGRIGGREFIPMTVTQGENTVSVVALKDTGNLLADPITGEQVLVLGPDAAQKLLGLTPEELKNPMKTLLEHPGRGFRLIPYHTVGQAGGMLLAKRFTDVKLGESKTGALVAFSYERIGNGDVYQALAGGNL